MQLLKPIPKLSHKVEVYFGFLFISSICLFSIYSFFLIIDKDKAPTLEVVFDLMKPYSARWNELGIALQIPHNYRQTLCNDRMTADRRLEEVIYKWIKSKCSPVTWDYLIHVIVKIMGLQLAVVDTIEGIVTVYMRQCPLLIIIHIAKAMRAVLVESPQSPMLHQRPLLMESYY